jgi:arginase family enzyme
MKKKIGVNCLRQGIKVRGYSLQLMSPLPKKIFGVAIDVADDPWSLQLKWASMMAARKEGDGLYADPYDAVANTMLGCPGFELGGKFLIPSWQGPRPQPSDGNLVSIENLQKFVANGGLLETMKRLQDFVERSIFPAFPVMVGIDHSATGGVISALTKRYSPETLSIVVLDRHFDAIPLSLRMDGLFGSSPGAPQPLDVNELDQYCCGNFWAYLIDAGIVLPEHLVFVGVADYPTPGIDPKWERLRERYLGFEERGCGFFPLWKFDGCYADSLTQFIYEKVETPYVYVSLDLDVGAYRCINAARYMDGPGITRENLLDIARIIAEGSQNGNFMLVGFDIMEFNIHFLGIETPQGGKDLTLPLVHDFIKTLTRT